MDDLDALIAATGPGPRDCGPGWWLTHGTHPDIDRLRTAVANPSAASTALARAFTDRGMPLADQAVARHRMGKCSCPQ